jgi:AcrR family transcriptional regulator
MVTNLAPPAKRANRRRPQQERSQHTVDAILSATKTLVVRYGLEKFTTNGVARLAGVSIGSLYQYFPSKRALIAELRRRHQATGLSMARDEAVQLMTAPPEVALRRFVAQMVAVHRVDPVLHRALELDAGGLTVGETERSVLAMIRAYMELHRAEIGMRDLDQAAFMVALTVHAVVHGTVIQHPEILNDDELTDDLVRMLLAYLRV